VELDVSQTHEKTIFQLTKIVKSIRDLITVFTKINKIHAESRSVYLF
jgi:hypothetical protein